MPACPGPTILIESIESDLITFHIGAQVLNFRTYTPTNLRDLLKNTKESILELYEHVGQELAKQ